MSTRNNSLWVKYYKISLKFVAYFIEYIHPKLSDVEHPGSSQRIPVEGALQMNRLEPSILYIGMETERRWEATGIIKSKSYLEFIFERAL